MMIVLAPQNKPTTIKHVYIYVHVYQRKDISLAIKHAI